MTDPHALERSFLGPAVRAARQGLAEGGIPIGAALVVDGEVIATGHNRRVQLGSAIRHGETDCLENAGRLPASTYARSIMVTTLVVGEHRTFMGGEDLLRSRGVDVVVLDDEVCMALMAEFIAAEPALWN